MDSGIPTNLPGCSENLVVVLNFRYIPPRVLLSLFILIDTNFQKSLLRGVVQTVDKVRSVERAALQRVKLKPKISKCV